MNRKVNYETLDKTYCCDSTSCNGGNGWAVFCGYAVYVCRTGYFFRFCISYIISLVIQFLEEIKREGRRVRRPSCLSVTALRRVTREWEHNMIFLITLMKKLLQFSSAWQPGIGGGIGMSQYGSAQIRDHVVESLLGYPFSQTQRKVKGRDEILKLQQKRCNTLPVPMFLPAGGGCEICTALPDDGGRNIESQHLWKNDSAQYAVGNMDAQIGKPVREDLSTGLSQTTVT